MAQEVKCVFVGDGAVGKTCALITYTEGKFPKEYVPTVFDNYEATIIHEGRELKFSLWDTAGEEGYARIRTLSYPKTDVFIIGFSIANVNSFTNVEARWLPEISHHCPTVPFIIAALKCDLRDDFEAHEQLKRDGSHMITLAEAQELGQRVGAAHVCESSSITKQGLKSLFDNALTIGMGHGEYPVITNRKKKCIVS